MQPEGFARDDDDVLEETDASALLAKLVDETKEVASRKAKAFATLHSRFKSGSELVDHLNESGFAMGNLFGGNVEEIVEFTRQLTPAQVIEKLLAVSEINRSLPEHADFALEGPSSAEKQLGIVQRKLRAAMLKRAAQESEIELAAHVLAETSQSQQDAEVKSFLHYLCWTEHSAMAAFEMDPAAAFQVYHALRSGDRTHRDKWVDVLAGGILPTDVSAYVALRRSPSAEAAEALGWSESSLHGASRKQKKSPERGLGPQGRGAGSLASLCSMLSSIWRIVDIQAEWTWTDAYYTKGHGAHVTCPFGLRRTA